MGNNNGLWQSLGTAGISSAGSIVGSIISSNAAKKQNERQIQYSKEAADTSWKRQLQLRAMDNAYNSPLAQVQRLRAAGLSPQLMYGSSGQASGSTSAETSAPMANNPYQVDESAALTSGLSSASSAFGASLQNTLIAGARRKQDAEASNLRATANYYDEAARKAGMSADYIQKQKEWYDDYIQSVINLNASNEALNEANKLCADTQANLNRSLTNLNDVKYQDVLAGIQVKNAQVKELEARAAREDAEAKKALQDIQESYSRIARNIAEANLANERADTEGHKRNVLDVEAWAKGEQGAVWSAQVDQIHQLTKNLEKEAEILSVKFKIAENERKVWALNYVRGIMQQVFDNNIKFMNTSANVIGSVLQAVPGAGGYQSSDIDYGYNYGATNYGTSASVGSGSPYSR